MFAHFLAEYAAGRTPNPDVLCNREIKFKYFLDAARELGAARIATGHYARVERHGDRWQLLRAADRGKDQSYFLHQLGQEQLADTLFPLGSLQKAEVRVMAQAAGLPTAAKKDSTGICFIASATSAIPLAFTCGPPATSTSRTTKSASIRALFYFTLGQREGLQLGGVRGHARRPLVRRRQYVERNILTVARAATSPYLLSRSCGPRPRCMDRRCSARRVWNAPRKCAIASMRNRALCGCSMTARWLCVFRVRSAR